MTHQITVLLSESIATISPYLHGQFVEHMGAVVYGGLWVGEQERIPHVRGWRYDMVSRLQSLAPPVIRWPGGCFADEYDWRDGLGPRETRPVRVTTRWGEDEIETNQVGTHEFVDFCRQVGAEPWLGVNVGSGTPALARDWAEYCNFGGQTTLTRQRAENGAERPLDVRFWGIGNESWDCGGKFTSEAYAREYARFESHFPRLSDGVPVQLIACGPDGNKAHENAVWTRGFLDELARWRWPRLHCYDAHFYTWNTDVQAGSATEYTPDQWSLLLAKARKVDDLIVQQTGILREYRQAQSVKLIIGEWGTWHRQTPERPLCWQQNSLRDALIAAQTLDIFHNRADRVYMANLAQMTNLLQSLFLTDARHGGALIVTPTYHVFRLYQAHRGGQAVRLFCDAGRTDTDAGPVPHLSGSASVKDGVITVSIVNAHPTEPLEAALNLTGVTALNGTGTVATLAAPDICAHNTVENPDAVTPTYAPLSELPTVWTFAPASVTVFTLPVG